MSGDVLIACELTETPGICVGGESVASMENIRLDPFISCFSCAIRLSACCL